MKCEKCIYYQARPALGNKFGWEVTEGCSHGPECSSSSTGTWIDNNNWAFLMLGIVLGAMFITLFVTFSW